MGREGGERGREKGGERGREKGERGVTMRDSNTVEPPNKGHFEANSFEELSLSKKYSMEGFGLYWSLTSRSGAESRL